MKFKVELSRRAKKDLQSVPRHIVTKLLDWTEDVEDRGLLEVRKSKGYHDEPLHGVRKGQRSIRLSKGYRGFYAEHDGEIILVEVLEVNKHDY